jgi:predicted nucleic acid-binding protein
MRAVVDTNILVRALIKPRGTVGPVSQRLRQGDYTLLYGVSLLEELVDVLN